MGRQYEINAMGKNLNQILAGKVPVKLQSTLDAAFAKVFETIFAK